MGKKNLQIVNVNGKNIVFGVVQAKTSIRDLVGRDREFSSKIMERGYSWLKMHQLPICDVTLCRFEGKDCYGIDINEAINIQYYEIKKNVNNVLKNKKQEIVLYCQTGFRSKQAYKKLIKLEYKKVYNLYGGLDNWT